MRPEQLVTSTLYLSNSTTQKLQYHMFTIEPTVVGYFQLCLHIFTIQRKKNNDGIVINEL